MVADGRVAPIIETYALDEHNRVRERLESGRVRYRAVLLHDVCAPDGFTDGYLWISWWRARTS